MNELLQKHGCSNVFTVPEGLRELMADITREVLREQPEKISDFIANYLSVLLITREHGIMAVKVMDDLCDCRPPVSLHLKSIGLDCFQAEAVAQMIKDAIEDPDHAEGEERVREFDIVKTILSRFVFDEDTTRKITQVIRNAYRDYVYRRMMLEKILADNPEEPWESAARHTLEIYKKTKPTFYELAKATETIQAAYRGYHVRRNLLRHVRPKSKPKDSPKVALPGPPVDVADSREIDLGRIIDINVKEDNVSPMFESYASNKLGLGYPAMRTITYEDNTRETKCGQPQHAGPHQAAAIDWSQQGAKRHTIHFDKVPSQKHTSDMIDVPDEKEDGSDHRSTGAASAASTVTTRSTISHTAADLLCTLEMDLNIPKNINTSGDEEADDVGDYDEGDGE